MTGADEWLFGGVDALSWSIGSLAQSLAGIGLFAVAGVFAVVGSPADDPLAAAATALALAYAVVVVTIQARDYYLEAETGVSAVLREGLRRVPVVFGIVLLCCYALFVVTVLGGAFVVLVAIVAFVLGPEFAVLALLPLAVHLLARVAVAVPVAVVDGVGPLRALEDGIDAAPAVLPRLFGLLTVLSLAALPLAGVELLFDGVPDAVVAFVAGGLTALGVTALTRVYLETRHEGRDDRPPSLRSVLRHRLPWPW